jgi:integrase/recombinase XerD
MSTELARAFRKDIAARSGGPILPAVIVQADDHSARRFVEFFTAAIHNPNTRRAYARAVFDFFAWCDGHRRALTDIEPVHVAA